MTLIFGDPHTHFSHILPLVEKHKPAAIILLGDMECSKPLEQHLGRVTDLTEVYWIHGNHDVDKQEFHTNLFESRLAKNCLHGKVIEIDGLKVAGLGGVFHIDSWYPKDSETTPIFDDYDSLLKSEHEKFIMKNFGKDPLTDPVIIGKSLLHKATIFYEDWLTFEGIKADVLITHEAPSCHPLGLVGIDFLAQNLDVKDCFHGHHHDNLDYSNNYSRLGFRAHGVGFCGVKDVAGHDILAGKFDK